ncbi:MAG: hypothetical protein E7470_04085 [Ruminococcaceae bacterium]|nr:hypothetical protein [Oscillospiraceae bacterium]
MSIPYRVRQMLRRFAIVLLVLVILAVALLASWLLWLSRYVVYTDEGAKIDFSLSGTLPAGEIATAPAPGETVPITYVDPDDLIPELPAELTQLNGYSVSAEMLLDDPDGVAAALAELPKGSTVLLSVKNLRGEFLYSSTLGRTSDKLDSVKVDRIIRTLKERGCYVIAEIPAFQDYWFFLDDENGRVPYGLPRDGGNGALWLDQSGPCYWLNPASNGALNYLVQIITELRTLGFDEVLLRNFRFPDTDMIRFEGDRYEALQKAANTLVQASAAETFTLSFAETDIILPEGRCRLYASGISAGDIPAFVSDLALADPTVQLVFLTDLLDTRFEQYSVLRPLDVNAE